MGKHLICLVNAEEQATSLSYSKLLGASENPGQEFSPLGPSPQLPDPQMCPSTQVGYYSLRGNLTYLCSVFQKRRIT